MTPGGAHRGLPPIRHSASPLPLRLLLVAALAGEVHAEEGTSPCAAQYADWVGKPDTFVRRAEPLGLQGFHVACLWRKPGGEDVGLNIEAYLNAVSETSPQQGVLPTSALSSWKGFRAELKAFIGFRKATNNWDHQELKQAFGIFDTSGKRLGSAEKALEASLVLVIEGGQWFWPPIRKGYVRQVSQEGMQRLELETLSVQPVIFRVRGFLHPEECDEIIKLGSGRMADSPVSLMDKDKGKGAKEFRTSTQARVGNDESKMLKDIGERVSRLTKIPSNHNEEVQILRYSKTQYYSAHLDNWDPSFYTGSETAFMEYGHKNRLITVFWYLTNVSKGGQTLFPRTDGLPQPMDMYSCAKGMKVKPELGAVIFWYSLHPNGNTDPNGLHAACPVEEGEKWSANYWVWNKPRQFRRWTSGKMPDEGVDDPEVAEQEAQEDGMDNVRDDDQVTVRFENARGGKTVHLFWQSPEKGKEETLLGSIAAGATSSMNSYPGHVWVVRGGPTAKDPLLGRVTVKNAAVQSIDVSPGAMEL